VRTTATHGGPGDSTTDSTSEFGKRPRFPHAFGTEGVALQRLARILSQAALLCGYPAAIGCGVLEPVIGEWFLATERKYEDSALAFGVVQCCAEMLSFTRVGVVVLWFHGLVFLSALGPVSLEEWCPRSDGLAQRTSLGLARLFMPSGHLMHA
jgi:uncharacterized membrane protein YhhN